jgi:peptidoglycan-associated lipoprotein
MKIQIKSAFVLLGVCAAFLAVAAPAQPSPTTEHGTDLSVPQPELAFTYSLIHTNAPPSGCGCFFLNGGSAALAWPIKASPWALAANLTDTHAGKPLGAGTDIDLSAYTAGARYTKRWSRSSWQPFGQVLLGVAHASGSLVQGQNSVTSNANAAFAAELGGGVDVRLSRHFALRLAEVNYLLTTFDNSTNNRQNNLDLNTGIVFRFGQ